MRSILFLVTLLFFISGCKHKQTLSEKKKELDAGQLNEKNIYIVKEVGWTTTLPEDWQVLTKRESDKINEKGKELVEGTVGTKIDMSNLIELLNFKKDLFNSFLSTMELYDEKKDGSYDDHNIAVHDLLKQTYASKNIPAEYELAALRIDDLMFDRFIIKIYSPDKKQVIINQEMFSCLINGYDFSMTINYNNEKDKETLMNVVTSSKFSKESQH